MSMNNTATTVTNKDKVLFVDFNHKEILPHTPKSKKKKNVTADSPLQTTANKKEPVAPIKKKEDIAKIKKYLASTGKYAMRNWLLFVLGINVGLRCSDIVRFRFCDVLEEDGSVRQDVTIYEQKTGKQRYTPLNKEVRKAVKAYIKSLNGGYTMEDYLFKSNKKSSPHLTVDSVRDIIKDAVENAVNITLDVKNKIHAGSHTMRKTFAYHFFMKNKDNQYALCNLQDMLNHASLKDTLRYIGLDRETKRSFLEDLLL